MNRQTTVRLHSFLITLTIASTLTGCSSSSFFGVNSNSLLDQTGGGGGGGGGPTCHNVLNETTKKLRISFMVDDSGSTKTTDPDHHYRVATVEAFLAKYGVKQNFTYSYGKFSGTTASIFDIGTSQFIDNPPQPFGNAQNLTTALNLYKATAPAGNTPYNAAFSRLKSIILDDIAVNPGVWEHAIVFMSDGVPTDIANPVATNVQTLVSTFVQDIKNANSNVAVSAVYFGPSTATDAINVMKIVANSGGGFFVDTNVSTNIQMDDVIQVPGVVCK